MVVLKELMVRRRLGGAFLLLLVFLAVAQLLRLILICWEWDNLSLDASLLQAVAWGMVFDLGAGLLFSVPLVMLLVSLPKDAFSRQWVRGGMRLGAFATLLLLVFGATAELVFWQEFSARFNFIAVDYLIYTTEVVGNIREFYSLPLLFAGIFCVAAVIFVLVERSGLAARWLCALPEPFVRRLGQGTLWLLLAGLLGAGLNQGMLPDFQNSYHRELAKNGLWSLFAAFTNNELDYRQFYGVLPERLTYQILHRELEQDGSVVADPAGRDTLRQVTGNGEELRLNVIQITVESLSAGFLGTNNHQSSLTPHLDAIAKDSLVFDNFYATGTRTDRGMEALALALPPTPGRSLVKRTHNEELFSLGSVFRAKGYDTAFIYGGYGYFDNMNYFFGENGYRIVDRTSVDDSAISFANAWGACDGDVFRWTLEEADAAFMQGKPFHFFVMTTSNHRPYTYPEGRIDLPPKTSGRRGAVKYTDFAIGELLRQASIRPWFNNTVFVIVADHCASSAGKTELPVDKYHIPLIIYAPGGQIAPGHISTLASQIDYAPTLLGLLGWTYQSRFFGHDVRKIDEDTAHAFIGNYQKVAYLKNDFLTVLKPNKQESSYTYDRKSARLAPAPMNVAALQETISYYQIASDMYRRGAYSALPR